MGRGGFEPKSVSNDNKELTKNTEPGTVQNQVHLLEKHPELTEIVRLWPGLPEYIRQAIKTLVKSFQVKENSNGA